MFAARRLVQSSLRIGRPIATASADCGLRSSLQRRSLTTINVGATSSNHKQSQSQSQSSSSSSAAAAALLNPMVVFVNGGPASGKGTQCKKLASEFGVYWISAGDLLRAELTRYEQQQSTGTVAAGEMRSVHGPLIQSMINSGQILPAHVTVELLRNEMQRARQSVKPNTLPIVMNEPAATAVALYRNDPRTAPLFVVDGFPRSIENLDVFERLIGPAQATITIDAPNQVLKQRLIARGKAGSGRSDDTEAIADKRLATFHRDTFPVLQRFATETGRSLQTVDGSASIDSVYQHTRKAYLASIGFLDTHHPYCYHQSRF